MSAPLTHEDFQPHLGREFRFSGQPQVLKLSQVDVMDHPPLPGMDHKAFALIFTGPRGDVLPEGFYAVEAEGGVRFEFYILPIHTPARDRQDYQAIFN
jgi:uncharacterized protein DUF6916